MSDAQDNTMDQKLADALSADDVASALAHLAREQADRPAEAERVAEMRRLHDQLSALRERIDAGVYPGPAWTAPPARQPRWKLAFRSAGMVAAAGIAVAVVLYLVNPPPASPPSKVDQVASTVRASQPRGSADVPAAGPHGDGLTDISPARLPNETFNLDIPSLSLPTVDMTGWTMPAISLPTLQDKEDHHES